MSIKEQQSSWLPVISLALAVFIVNTTEFIPIGLLPNIADSFSMSVAHTGLLITGYAWIVFLMSLPLTIVTAQIERRKLLIILFLLFIACHILIVLAWSFTILMLARMGAACMHAVFFSITVPLAVRLAPNGKKTKALGLMVTGTALATVLGVPLGTIIGQYAGWRTSFAIIAIAALLVTFVLMFLLPRLPSLRAGSLRSLPLLFKRPALMYCYLLLAIVITGHFTAYTYITPFMKQIAGFSANYIVLLLLLNGAAGLIGSLLFSKFSDKYPIACLLLPIFMLIICLLSMVLVSASQINSAIMVLVWGVVLTMLAIVLQTKVLEVAADATDVATAIFSGVFNIGIGGGALIGSKVLLNFGTQNVGYIGAIFVAFGLVLAIIVSKRYWSLHSAGILKKMTTK